MRPPANAVACFAALLATSCSPPAVEQRNGELWPHRDRIAAALTIRTGQLSGTFYKPAKACNAYWITGDRSRTTWGADICDQRGQELRERLSTYLNMPISPSALRDAALWRYVAKRANF